MAATVTEEELIEGGEPQGREPGVREQLIAELERTVDNVMAAVDSAAARTIAAAEEEADRRTREASVRLATTEETIARMRELTAELARRTAGLERELDRLAELAAEADAGMNAGAAPLGQVGSGAPGELGEVADIPEEFDLGPTPTDPESLDPLDQIEIAREQLRDAARSVPGLRRFRRRRREEDDVPEGVRVVVAQMRLDGRSDAEILARLERMGIENAAEVLLRFSK